MCRRRRRVAVAIFVVPALRNDHGFDTLDGSGSVSCLSATSTLALDVNLPSHLVGKMF